jgi:arylsulfatase A-like enzyme
MMPAIRGSWLRPPSNPLRGAQVGYHNPGHVNTPNMDALSSGGIRLDRHYTAYTCGPSRSSLLSGRLPHHVNQYGDERVPRGFTLLPRKLQQVGYATHQIGKVRVCIRGRANSLRVLQQCSCTGACTRTRTRTHTRTNGADAPTHAHTYSHTFTYVLHAHTHTNSIARACYVHAGSHTYTQARHRHTRTHSYAHPPTHTHPPTPAHPHTHTHVVAPRRGNVVDVPHVPRLQHKPGIPRCLRGALLAAGGQGREEPVRLRGRGPVAQQHPCLRLQRHVRRPAIP